MSVAPEVPVAPSYFLVALVAKRFRYSRGGISKHLTKAQRSARSIVRAFLNVRQRRREEHNTCFASSAMPREISRDLTGAYGVANEDDFLQPQVLDHRREVVSERVEVISGSRITGSTATALVVSHRPYPRAREVEHLVLPHVRVKRPTVYEDNNTLARPPVLAEQARA